MMGIITADSATYDCARSEIEISLFFAKFHFNRNKVHFPVFKLPLSRKLCFCVCWFVRQQDNSKSCRRILRTFFGGLGCVISNKRLVFSDDPDNDADSGFFSKEFFYRYSM